MYRIGIDVGSTYTKYCIMDGADKIIRLFSEETPIQQRYYFDQKCAELQAEYSGAAIVSCGYGKKNAKPTKSMNELTALAKGANYAAPETELVLDIGGQDTKIIRHEQGRIKQFFLNDKCAAGSGMFLTNTRKLLGINFEDIDLRGREMPVCRLSSSCAVFAQSEIVELIADNQDVSDIIYAVVWQILTNTKPLLQKLAKAPILLSGGLTQLKGIQKLAEIILRQECKLVENSAYLSAIGCVLD